MTSALKGELTMQCSSCGKTLLPGTTVCPMCKTPGPTRGSAKADDEYTEYADVPHQPIPFVETKKSFFNVQPSSPVQETTLSEHQDRQLVPPHHLQSEKREMRYNSMELVTAIAFLLLGLTFLGGGPFFSFCFCCGRGIKDFCARPARLHELCFPWAMRTNRNYRS